MDRWVLGEAHRLVATGHRGAGGLRHPAGRHAARVVRRPAVELVRPSLASPLLGRRPGRAGHAPRGAVRRDPADGSADPVHHRAGLAGHRSAPRRTGAGSVHLAAWPGRQRAWSTTSSTRRWRLDATPGRARPGRARRRQGEDAPAAASRARRVVGVRRSRRGAAAPRSPTSSTSAPSSRSPSAGDLVDFGRRATSARSASGSRKQTPVVAAAIAAADARGRALGPAGRAVLVDGARRRCCPTR